MPEKIQEMRLRVAVANSKDPFLAVAPPQAPAITHQPQASTSWGDMMDDGSTEMPPLFEDLLEGELHLGVQIPKCS